MSVKHKLPHVLLSFILIPALCLGIALAVLSLFGVPL